MGREDTATIGIAAVIIHIKDRFFVVRITGGNIEIKGTGLPSGVDAVV
jgi:hypothetical protein